MKKMIAMLLAAASVLSFCGCAGENTAPETTQAPAAVSVVTEAAATEAAAVPEETEAPVPEGSLFVKVSSINFSLVGDSEDIYLGLVPREEVTWESENPDVVSVENGVLTATGVGTTRILATYGNSRVEITAGCLAQTQEELDQLDPQVLSAPKRLPPEVDMEVPCTYFDNAALIGDSITYFLWQAESQNNYLGDVVFVTRQGVSINSLVRRFKNMYFEGIEMFIEDIAAKCPADRIYIMLGCLDYQVPAAMEQLIGNWNTMLDRIHEKCPEKEIVIISNIPSFTEDTGPNVYNEAVAKDTVQLRQIAEERGHGFLDLGYYVQDHYGRMPQIYCQDEYHMNAEGSLTWMKVMRYYAQYELEGGALK